MTPNAGTNHVVFRRSGGRIRARLAETSDNKAKGPPVPRSIRERADTVIVAAIDAIRKYQHLGEFVCQPFRTFRPVTYLGFYARKRIESFLPRIVTSRQAVVFDDDTVAALRSTGDPVNARVSEIVDADLRWGGTERQRGKPYQVVPLDEPAGLRLQQPIQHEGSAAWTQRQHYTVSQALLTQPATTAELEAAGG